MSQNTFTQDPVIGRPGQLQDAADCQIVNHIAASDIEPGRIVEIDSNGRIAYPQGTTLGKVVGVAMYVDAALPQSWKAGDMVPVVRKGRVFAQLSGGTTTFFGSANVNHSSTIATNRGKVSASATSVTAGSEVSSLGPVVFVRPLADTTLCLVELNLA